MAIGIAVEADQAGAFARVADAVYLVASQVEADDGVEEGAWDHLADAVGDSRLAGLVEAARG